VAKNANRICNSQNENSSQQNTKRDEVLKRPLKMKPQPQNKSTTNEDRDLNFADSKESSEISDEGNRQVARMQFLSCNKARDSDDALSVV
jgi:hypothetical protein